MCVLAAFGVFTFRVFVFRCARAVIAFCVLCVLCLAWCVFMRIRCFALFVREVFVFFHDRLSIVWCMRAFLFFVSMCILRSYAFRERDCECLRCNHG